jgi:hypothetical protein
VELKLTDDDTSAGSIIEEFSDQDGDISYTFYSCFSSRLVLSPFMVISVLE